MGATLNFTPRALACLAQLGPGVWEAALTLQTVFLLKEKGPQFGPYILEMPKCESGVHRLYSS